MYDPDKYEEFRQELEKRKQSRNPHDKRRVRQLEAILDKMTETLTASADYDRDDG